MTQRSNCSPLSLHFLIPQMNHRNVPGDLGSSWHPLWQGEHAAACCSAPLWSRSESPFPIFGLEPMFPSNTAEMGQAADGQHPALPLVTAQTQWLLLLWVTIQGSLCGFVWCFCFSFQLILKNPCIYPLSRGICCTVTAFGTAVSHTISQSYTLVSPALPE